MFCQTLFQRSGQVHIAILPCACLQPRSTPKRSEKSMGARPAFASLCSAELTSCEFFANSSTSETMSSFRLIPDVSIGCGTYSPVSSTLRFACNSSSNSNRFSVIKSLRCCAFSLRLGLLRLRHRRHHFHRTWPKSATSAPLHERFGRRTPTSTMRENACSWSINDTSQREHAYLVERVRVDGACRA